MQPGWKYSVLCTPAKRALNGHTTHLSTRQTGVPKHLVLLLTCLQGTKHQARFANTFFVGCIIVTNGSIFCALSTGRTGYRHSQTDAQASAVSCYQSLQSRSWRDKITWSHRGACTSEVWLPHADFMVPSLCCAIQVPVATAALEERMLLPAHKGRCSLRATEEGNFWFATENVPTDGQTSCTNWPGSQLCKQKLAHHTLGFWKLEDDLKNHWGT